MLRQETGSIKLDHRFRRDRLGPTVQSPVFGRFFTLKAIFCSAAWFGPSCRVGRPSKRLVRAINIEPHHFYPRFIKITFRGRCRLRQDGLPLVLGVLVAIGRLLALSGCLCALAPRGAPQLICPNNDPQINCPLPRCSPALFFPSLPLVCWPAVSISILCNHCTKEKEIPAKLPVMIQFGFN